MFYSGIQSYLEDADILPVDQLPVQLSLQQLNHLLVVTLNIFKCLTSGQPFKLKS